MTIPTPCFFVYYNKTYRIDSTPEGGLAGQLLDLETGEFTKNSRLIDTVLFNRAPEINSVDEAEFIDETEQARSFYLRGDGPIFALYETVNGLYTQRKIEKRRLTPEERALIRSLRQRTFQLWAEEFDRRNAGEPASFQFKTILGPMPQKKAE